MSCQISSWILMSCQPYDTVVVFFGVGGWGWEMVSKYVSIMDN